MILEKEHKVWWLHVLVNQGTPDPSGLFMFTSKIKYLAPLSGLTVQVFLDLLEIVIINLLVQMWLVIMMITVSLA